MKINILSYQEIINSRLNLKNLFLNRSYEETIHLTQAKEIIAQKNHQELRNELKKIEAEMNRKEAALIESNDMDVTNFQKSADRFYYASVARVKDIAVQIATVILNADKYNIIVEQINKICELHGVDVFLDEHLEINLSTQCYDDFIQKYSEENAEAIIKIIKINDNLSDDIVLLKSESFQIRISIQKTHEIIRDLLLRDCFITTVPIADDLSSSAKCTN